MPLRENLGREVTRGTLCKDHWQVTVGLWCADVLPPGAPTPLLVNVAWRATEAGLPPRPGDARLALVLRKKAESALSDARFDAPDGPSEKLIPGDLADGVFVMYAATTATRPGEPDLQLVVKVDGKDKVVIDLAVAAPAVPPPLAVKAENGTDAAPAALGFTRPVRVRAVPAAASGGRLRWVSATPSVAIAGDATQATVGVTGRLPADGGALPELRIWVLSADASGATVVAGHRFQPAARVAVRLRRAGATGDPPPLLLGWVYWKADGTTTTLRTDREHGLLLALKEGGDRANPWDYTEAFDWPAGAAVEAAYSLGAKPLPDAVLTERAGAFTAITLPQPGTPPPGEPPRVAIDLPDLTLTVTRPAELTLWPLTLELPGDAWHTEGIAQGAALWTGTPAHLTVNEGGAAPALAAAAAGRPRERGLRVEGTVEAAATAVRLKLLDAAGAVLRLRTGIDPGAAQADEVAATLAVPAGATRGFTANLFLADAAAAAGPVQLLVLPDGVTPLRTDAVAVHLCRAQAALVDDHEAAVADGTQRGPLRGEAAEVIDLDFRTSPQNTVPLITAQARARRMVRYEIAVERRLFDGTAAAGPANPQVPTPQMPMWMAELQLLGLSWDQLRDLMARVHYRTNAPLAPDAPRQLVDLRLALDWTLELSWDGPDTNSNGVAPAPSRPNQHYAYSLSIPGAQAVRLRFRDGGQPVNPAGDADVNPTTDGELDGAFETAPTAIAYPVAGRRLPKVFVQGQTRPWGRGAGAPQRDALVVEFQPRVEAGGGETIRGGDGRLSLALQVNGQAVDPGMARGSGGALALPAPADPLLRLPRFRVRGVNPAPHADVVTLINALVQQIWTNNNAAHVRFLDVPAWQVTAVAIFQAENGGDSQFDERGIGRRGNDTRTIFYGCEDGMPLFGFPHGYGFGQLDSLPGGRGANDGEAWSFVENLRTAVDLIMDSKGQAAYNATIAPHLPFGNMRRARAVFRRDVVRRYNGGSEFTWTGADWAISPSISQWIAAGTPDQRPNPRLPYPNHVLGTAIAYWNGPEDATATFPWPIPFVAADFGPGI
jgi:hypothetical protein